MTRQLSVSRIKGVRGGPSLTGLPREGTVLRQLYDRFHANAGGGIAIDSYNSTITVGIQQLINFYGCDIRCCGRKQYVLAGEIIDGTYVDYVAKLVETERKN